MRTRWILSGVSMCGALLAGCKLHADKPAAPLPSVNVTDSHDGTSGLLTTVPPSSASPISRVLGEAKPQSSTPANPTPMTEPHQKPRDLFVSGVVRPMPEPTPALVVPPADTPTPMAMPATIVATPPEPTPSITIPTAGQTTPSAVVTTTEARSRLEHAADYRWLVGEVTYSSAKKEWRLRYADLGDSDDYGGSVTLTGSGHWFEKLRDGQRVRVEGELLHKTPSIAPPYRVTLLRVVD